MGLRSLPPACAACGCVTTWRPKKRLKALEAKSAQVLTEAQVVALEKGETEKEAQGEFEFESEHPGYCGAQDTLCRWSAGSWFSCASDQVCR